MTDLTVRATATDSIALAKLRLPELQALAAQLGLSGSSRPSSLLPDPARRGSPCYWLLTSKVLQ